MKKVLKPLLCIMIVLSLSACSFPVSEQEREYRAAYEETLIRTGAALSEEEIREEEKENPDNLWITSRIALPGSELYVSADTLQTHIDAYDVYYSHVLEDYEPLGLTVRDVVDLYKTPNAEKQARFEELADWYSKENYPTGPHIITWYLCFAVGSRRKYEAMYGEPFVDKENKLYTAEDIYALAQWGLEHIDYDFCKDVYENYEDPKYDDIDVNYVNFLCSINLFGDYVGHKRIFIDYWD